MINIDPVRAAQVRLQDVQIKKWRLLNQSEKIVSRITCEMSLLMGKHTTCDFFFNAEILDHTRESLLVQLVPLRQRAVRRLNLSEENILYLISAEQHLNSMKGGQKLNESEKANLDLDQITYALHLSDEQRHHEIDEVEKFYAAARDRALDELFETFNLLESVREGDEISFKGLQILCWVLFGRLTGTMRFDLPELSDETQEPSLCLEELENRLRRILQRFEIKGPSFKDLIPKTFLFKWIVDHREVYLLNNNNDNLACYVFDTTDGLGVQFPIECGEYPLPLVAQRLTLSAPILDQFGNVNFSVPTSKTHQRWNILDKQISLIQKQDHLAWELFDKTLNTKSWIPVTNDMSYFLYYLAHLPEKSSRDFFQQHSIALDTLKLGYYDQSINTEHKIITHFFLKHIPIQDRLDLFCDFTVTDVEETNGQLQSVALKKITELSRLDNKITVDRDRWAVTFVTTGTSQNKPTTWGGHAVIIIEGVRKGSYFLDRADFIDSGVRFIEDFPTEKLKYSGKTETWPRLRVDTENMIAVIQWEAKTQAMDQNPVLFNIFGRGSILNPPQSTTGVNWDKCLAETPLNEGEFVAQPLLTPDNCATWAAEKLDLAKIKIPPSMIKKLITIPKTYTHALSDCAGDVQECSEQSTNLMCVIS
jgi:hypothetical protein